MNCKHHACRCARAAELAAMADSTGRTSLLVDALAVHEQEVECRMDRREWPYLRPGESVERPARPMLTGGEGPVEGTER